MHHLAGTPPRAGWVLEVVLEIHLVFDLDAGGRVRVVLAVPPAGAPMPMGRAATTLLLFLAHTRLAWRSPALPMVAYHTPPRNVRARR